MSANQSQILVEVCVGSLADVAAAAAAGADRVELCGSLELGGVTPSIGTVETVLEASSLPIVVMVRPRAGGFCYDRHEFAAMLRDTERFLALGAGGVVFGALDRNGRIDAPRAREIADRAAPRAVVFHRAFDFVADWRTEIEVLIEMGCTRVLTGGGRPTAAAGAATLREMIGVAAGRIEILPAGGIRAANVAEIVRTTRCRQVHIGAGWPADDGSPTAGRGIELSASQFIGGSNYRAVDAAEVTAAISALRGAPLS